MKLTAALKYFFMMFLCLSFSGRGKAQNYPVQLWKPMTTNGTLGFLGQYRSQETILKTKFRETPEISLLTGDFKLQSKSYILHPNFMLLDLDLGYQPGSQQENYLVIPDRSESRTFKRGRMQTTFFDQKPLSFTLFGDYNYGFINREFVSNVRTTGSGYGGGLSFRNPVLPFQMSFNKSSSDQKELQTGREYNTRTKSFQTQATKSFSERDEHQLTYTLNDYFRKYFNATEINTKISSVNLKNRIALGKDERSNFYSYIWFDQQTGIYKFDRLQVFENLGLQLPFNFSYFSNYQFSRFEQPAFKSRQDQFNNRLEHQLFLSLRSQIYHEYSVQKQTTLNEIRNTAGLSFNYQKKIPTGMLNLNYEFRQMRLSKRNLLPMLTVINEEHNFNVGESSLLEQPYVVQASIIITDETESILYQENFDYFLIERGEFLEIQRLPGGQISPQQTVLIDYTAQQQPSFDYDSFNYNFSGSLSVFHRFLDVYFRYSENDYGNISAVALPVLKYLKRYVYGVRSSIGGFSGGYEWDDFNSNIVPYYSRRYFINFSALFFNRIHLVFTGNSRDQLLEEENERQIFKDISGKFMYNVPRIFQFSTEGSYRYQKGRGLDLDLSTFKTEISTKILAFYFTLGYEIYKRDFSGEKINYKGGFVKVERRF